MPRRGKSPWEGEAESGDGGMKRVEACEAALSKMPWIDERRLRDTGITSDASVGGGPADDVDDVSGGGVWDDEGNRGEFSE
jgi:hypothetical protein